MRTATPIETCSSTRVRPMLSAITESISTPRFMGPGCMTLASGSCAVELFAGESIAVEVLARRRHQSLPHALDLEAQNHDDVGARGFQLRSRGGC